MRRTLRVATLLCRSSSRVLKKREDRLGPEVVQVQLDGRTVASGLRRSVARAPDCPDSSGWCGDSSLALGAGDRRRRPGGLAPSHWGRRRSLRTSPDGRSGDEVAAVVGESRAGRGRDGFDELEIVGGRDDRDVPHVGGQEGQLRPVRRVRRGTTGGARSRRIRDGSHACVGDDPSRSGCRPAGRVRAWHG